MTPDKPIVDGLWNEGTLPPAPEPEQYWNHVMEQYKVYVEMADRVSARRVQVNTFFLTLHTVLIGAVGFAYEKGPAMTRPWLLLFPLAALLALCFTWWRIVKSYRQLNSGKYKVIGEFERRLPTSPFWAAEWMALGEGKDPKLYQPLTHVENWVPIIFGAIYVGGVAAMICL